jgi:hypothetical protein
MARPGLLCGLVLILGEALDLRRRSVSIAVLAIDLC